MGPGLVGEEAAPGPADITTGLSLKRKRTPLMEAVTTCGLHFVPRSLAVCTAMSRLKDVGC